jgi:uncharacterized protein (TIGR00251 family)
VRVQPRASREGIDGWQGGALRVRVSAPPVDGDANRAVIDVLARALGLRPTALTIARGIRAREKLVQVKGLSPGDVERRLGERPERSGR